MYIEHNSQNTFYRSPFGAAAANTEITLRLSVASEHVPDIVQLALGGRLYVMHYLTEVAGARVYEYKYTPVKPAVLWYYFIVDRSIYYGNNPQRLGGRGKMYYEVPESMFQITVHSEGFKTPDWMKHAIVYQIFPDRFRRAGDTPICGIRRAWGEMPFFRAEDFGGEYLSCDFFGGNFDGIIEKLTFLKELGVSAIYLNPIFRAFSNHKYDTGDYEHVDPTFGGDEAFDRLIEAARRAGIRIILDGVFSHTGSDSRYFNKKGSYDSVGAYQSQNSPYFRWYRFLRYPDNYECWWGFQTLPNVRETEPSYMDYILRDENSIVKRWLRRGASGWRLDVADELPPEFIKELRRAVKGTDREAVIIGEVWEDASNKVSYGTLREYLLGGELDSVMNYPLRDAIMNFVAQRTDAWRFYREVMSLKENYPREAFYCTLNILSSHDVPRALTVLGDAPDARCLTREQQAAFRLENDKKELAVKRLKLASLLQMTLPGTPCIYYGDEAGMEGYSDPFNRQTYPWGKENKELLSWYKFITGLRNGNVSLRTGSFEIVLYTGTSFGFLRSTQSGCDEFGVKAEKQGFVIVVNASSEHGVSCELDLGRFEIARLWDIIDKTEYFPNEKGRFAVSLLPLGYKILRADTISENSVNRSGEDSDTV